VIVSYNGQYSRIRQLFLIILKGTCESDCAPTLRKRDFHRYAYSNQTASRLSEFRPVTTFARARCILLAWKSCSVAVGRRLTFTQVKWTKACAGLVSVRRGRYATRQDSVVCDAVASFNKIFRPDLTA
jgi:hypothetical protein